MQSGQVLSGVVGIVIVVWYVLYRINMIRGAYRNVRTGRPPFSGDPWTWKRKSKH